MYPFFAHPALHPTEKGERREASPLAAVPACGHSKPSVQSPPPSPHRRKASLVKGRCRACEAEGFLPVCGCDSVQGIARRNPSGRLRRPPAPLLALRATSPGTGESVFDKGGRTVEKLHSCLVARVGATIGRPPVYCRNAISVQSPHPHPAGKKPPLSKGGAEPARRRDSCPSAGVTACRA